MSPVSPNEPSHDKPKTLDKIWVIGDFVLVSLIGSGTMGQVYLASHRTTGKRVALKVINQILDSDEVYIKRFNRECTLLSQLDHPAIARALSFGTDQGFPYLVMEFVHGDNYEKILAQQGPLPADDVLRLVIQVAKGLEYAFQTTGLIHRDIKPANLIHTHLSTQAQNEKQLTKHVKIVDFGLAKIPDSTSPDLQLTMTGFMMGTPPYMSPEQIRGEDTISFHADMYALGATMFQLLTGREPYPHRLPSQYFNAHLHDSIPCPSEVISELPAHICSIVCRCLAKCPADRFPDYATLIKQCEEALAALSNTKSSLP